MSRRRGRVTAGGVRWSARGLDRFEGAITAGGFGGHRVVVGWWRRSPLGSFADVMWVDPAGRRVLLAPTGAVEEYLSGIYTFDDTTVLDVSVDATPRRLRVAAGPLEIVLRPGPRDWRSWVFAARPRLLRRSPAWLQVEDRLAGPLGHLLLGGAPGVRVAGVTPDGRWEWYGVDDYRPVVGGGLRVDGRDAGPLEPLRGELGVGVSAFPTRPALVQLTTLIEPAPTR